MSKEKTGNTTLRYSDEELNEFKILFQEKLEVAEAELIRLHGMMEQENQKETNVDEMIKEQQNQMLARHISLIEHLKQSLSRIEDKTFGICSKTGRLIEKEILLALPHGKIER